MLFNTQLKHVFARFKITFLRETYRLYYVHCVCKCRRSWERCRRDIEIADIDQKFVRCENSRAEGGEFADRNNCDCDKWTNFLLITSKNCCGLRNWDDEWATVMPDNQLLQFLMIATFFPFAYILWSECSYLQQSTRPWQIVEPAGTFWHMYIALI